MAQAYKTIHEYQSLTVASTNLNVLPAGTNLILTSAQDGNVVLLNATAGSIVNLPSPQSGALFTFLVSATGGHVVAAPSASIYGSIMASNPTAGSSMLTTGPAKTTISTTTGSAVGDTFTLVSDGTNFYVKGSVANFNAAKFM